MKPIVLCILDGVGYREEKFGNAYLNAKHPFLDELFQKYPHSLLEASGVYVGLPKDVMGNSEVGHMNIGSGRIIYQPSELITREIENGKFYQNDNILKIFDHVKKNNSALHIMGLISDGQIHSSIKHLYALLKMAKENGLNKVYIHGFSDGRDSNPHSGIEYFEELQKYLNELGIGKIVTIIGRYYAMDRDNRWDRVKKAYDAIMYRIGEENVDASSAIKKSYDKNVTDEFIEPIILDKNIKLTPNDAIIDFNFRPDRLRELLSALSNPEFKEFETLKMNLPLLTFMPVASEVICTNAYKTQKIDMPLGVSLVAADKSQLRIAETEKYAHVTYFFDGGIERDLKNCTRILIPSPKVATYDETPNMSAKEITDTLLNELDKDIHDVVILNYANGDMVGHTGNLDAAIKSVEFLDECLKRLYSKVKEKDGLLIITADHGNCEYMIDENNEPVTSHTTNKVPFLITDEKLELKDGKLSDIAPTILNLLDINKPKEMTGESLIK